MLPRKKYISEDVGNLVCNLDARSLEIYRLGSTDVLEYSGECEEVNAVMSQNSVLVEVMRTNVF